jgi:hypothetical protein
MSRQTSRRLAQDQTHTSTSYKHHHLSLKLNHSRSNPTTTHHTDLALHLPTHRQPHPPLPSLLHLHFLRVSLHPKPHALKRQAASGDGAAVQRRQEGNMIPNRLSAIILPPPRLWQHRQPSATTVPRRMCRASSRYLVSRLTLVSFESQFVASDNSSHSMRRIVIRMNPLFGILCLECDEPLFHSNHNSSHYLIPPRPSSPATAAPPSPAPPRASRAAAASGGLGAAAAQALASKTSSSVTYVDGEWA